MKRCAAALPLILLAVGIGCGDDDSFFGPGSTTQTPEPDCDGGECDEPDPCESAPLGDGWYCGESLGVSDTDTRYHCVDGQTVGSEPCAHGCNEGACILPDVCAAMVDGWYCGESLGMSDTDTLYHCVGGLLVETQHCDHGCSDGECGVLSDPCENAALGNGWYCGESLGAGDLDTRYYCVDGQTADSEQCEFGCSRQPPGQHDLCAPDPSGYLLPLQCNAYVKVTQGNFGTYSHNGMSAYAFDFYLVRGTPVVASRGGTVSRVKTDITPGHPCWEGGGPSCANNVNYVLVAHDDGTGTLYLHLDQASVTVSTAVGRGQVVGLSGSTGHSTGPHLHFQRQELCGSWWCQSVAISFDDVPFKSGVPEKDDWVTSGNCP